MGRSLSSRRSRPGCGIHSRRLTMIEVTQLGKTYPGGVEAVKGVDFEVRAGEVFGLLGPNGAGKSTTIGMLTTTIEPTSGTARRAGVDGAEELRARRAGPR